MEQIPSGTVAVRRATPDDDARLLAIDLATWDATTSPAPNPGPDGRPGFFDDDLDPDDVLVAEVEGAIVGYVKLGPRTPLASNAHVLEVNGFAVDPVVQRRGVGRALLRAAQDEAVRRGVRKLTLRVLGHNMAARQLYARLGFRVEGHLRGEFVLDGVEVDDLLLAWRPDGGDGGRTLDGLAADDLDGSPMALVREWFEAAEVAGERQPWATVLSTVGADGRPSSRAVLVRGIHQGDEGIEGLEGLVFHTNRESRKGRDLATNPVASMCSVWHTLHRQVRVEGRIELAPDEVSDAYWAGRPTGSQVSAKASPQSEPIASRDWLEAEVRRVAAEHPDGPPRPAQWGGYVLVPDRIEFWVGRRDRLHDRVEFLRRPDGGWDRRLLAP